MRKWLVPVEIGILAGIILGWQDTASTCQSGFSYRFYASCARTFAASVDALAIRWVCVLLLVYLGVKVCVRVGDRYRISALLLPLAVWLAWQHTFLKSTFFEATHLLANWDKSLLIESISNSIPQLIGALLVLVLGFVVFRHVRVAGREMQIGFFGRIGRTIGTVVDRSSTLLSNAKLVLLFVSVALVVINLLPGILWLQTSLANRERPNIVFMMVDTLRADHLGCYGYTRNTTPNIDRLARDGLRFDHAISQAPFTDWSVPSFLASKYPQVAGSLVQGLAIQRCLAEQGYATGGIVSNLDGYGRDPRTSPNTAFQYWDERPCQLGAETSSPAVLSATINWLDRVKDRKFFLFSLFMDPHTPYIRHKEYDFDPENNGKLPDRIELSISNNDPRFPMPCDIRHIAALYDSEIAYTDEHVGRLLDYLKNNGLYDKSLIVLLSDHGEEFHDHGALYHTHTLYNELLGVPLIIKLPYQHKGAVVKGNFSLIDLFPSIASYVGIDPSPFHTDGRAVKLAGLKEVSDAQIFSANMIRRSIQNTTYKLIVTSIPKAHTERMELFHLEDDSRERHNVAGKCPAVAQKMRSLLLDHEKQIGAVSAGNNPNPGTNAAMSLLEADRLRSLGYIAK